jgi:hypothetical protein
MGDALQQVYDREGFEIHCSVKIRCLDNFRSRACPSIPQDSGSQPTGFICFEL